LICQELRRRLRALRSACFGGLFRCLRQGAPVIGIASLSVLTTLFVQRTLNPPAAAAQSSQPQEVRASMFTLVGPEGTALARLEPGFELRAGLRSNSARLGLSVFVGSVKCW